MIRLLTWPLLMVLSLAASALAQDSPGLTLDFGGARPPQGVKVSTNYTWIQDGALTFHDEESSAQVTFQIPDDQDPSGWVMEVTDRIANLQPGQEWTVFPSFTMNGGAVQTGAIPWYEWRTTTYPVGPMLRTGKNVLNLSSNVTEAWEYQVDRIRIGPPAN